MGKVRKETKLKALNEVLKMPLSEAREYIKKNTILIHEEYSQQELLSVFSYVHSGLYKEGEVTADRRQAWVINHAFITRTICDKINSEGRMPAVSEISKETKLSRVTVTKHLKHFEKDEYLQLHLQKWKLVTEKVLTKLSKYVFSEYVGHSDSIKAAATYLKFADKVLQPVKGSEPINNYIQINNIFINQETIKSLPEEKRKTIETLILEANEINQPQRKSSSEKN